MSITLPPLPEPTYGLGNGCERTYAYSADAVRAAQLAAVGAERASRPQTVPSELRAAAAAVVACWNDGRQMGHGIARLGSALEAVEAPPVAQAQPESAPARVPMTTAEVRAIYNKWQRVNSSMAALMRAVELHHGIGSAT